MVAIDSKIILDIHYISRHPRFFIQFSVDDFERVATSPWEGVRNYEARNLMKEMKVGEKVNPSRRCLWDQSPQAAFCSNLKALFYHSNCKTPGKH